MCDVIKIRPKRKDVRRSVGKETLKKKWLIDVFYDVTPDPFRCPVVEIRHLLRKIII